MEMAVALKFICAFIFVMGLMVLFSWFLKKIGLAGTAILPGSKRRLKIVEHLPIDHRRKLVIVRRDDREHLLVLGPSGETVIESNIPVVENVVELIREQKSVQG